MARISSKTMKANVVRRTRVTAMIGRSKGSVMFQKLVQPEEPSTSAAS